MRYTKLTGVVLKKHSYRETDQMVTLWTREAGKVRVMARGLKQPKSKLAYAMQDLNLVEVESAGRSAIPTLISAKVSRTYPRVREALPRTLSAFYAVELMMKMTADEQANNDAYESFVSYLDFLDSCTDFPEPVFRVVDSFSLRLMRCLGFSLEYAQNTVHMPENLRDHLNLLSETEYANLPAMPIDDKVSRQAHGIVKNFIEFILERNMKSDPFLSGI